MAKQEAAPKAPKPRLRNIRELMLLEPVITKAGAKPVFQRDANTSIVADLDAQIITLKLARDRTYVIPFVRCKYWYPDVGVPSE